MLSAVDTTMVAFIMIRRTVILFLSLSISAQAVEKIEVQGLFSNKAVLLIDGKRHIIAVDETSPEGVKLISATSHAAVLEVDGKQKQYTIGGSRFSTTYVKPKIQKEIIYKNSAGMYMTYGRIDGRSVQFLVDTGASAISMNVDQAKQLGIRFETLGIPTGVSTASGFVKANRVRLQSVTIGKITQNNIDAFVIDGNHPGPILLGMTFLGRISVEHSGNTMTLSHKE